MSSYESLVLQNVANVSDIVLECTAFLARFQFIWTFFAVWNTGILRVLCAFQFV